MTCPDCGKNHPRSYHLEKKIARKGFPTASKFYESSHKAADVQEKKDHPKGYEKMKKVDSALPEDELAGKNTRSGRIDVSRKVPRPLRAEVAEHEAVENAHIRNRYKHSRG